MSWAIVGLSRRLRRPGLASVLGITAACGLMVTPRASLASPSETTPDDASADAQTRSNSARSRQRRRAERNKDPLAQPVRDPNEQPFMSPRYGGVRPDGGRAFAPNYAPDYLPRRRVQFTSALSILFGRRFDERELLFFAEDIQHPISDGQGTLSDATVLPLDVAGQVLDADQGAGAAGIQVVADLHDPAVMDAHLLFEIDFVGGQAGPGARDFRQAAAGRSHCTNASTVKR